MNTNEYTKGDNRYFFKMFRFVKPYAFPFFFGKIMHSTQGFALPFIISVFSASVMYAITSRNIGGVYSAVMLLVAMFVGFMLLFITCVYVFEIAAQRAVRDMKKLLFRCFVRNSLENAVAAHSGEGIAAINTDADIAASVYNWPLSSFLINLINIVFSSVVVFVVDWRMGFASLAIGFLGFVIQNRFTEPLADVNRRWLTANADTVKSVSNVFSGAITLRAYNMQDKAEKSFEPENHSLRRLGIKEGLITAWQDLFSVKLDWLALVASFGLGGFLVATGRLEFHLLMMLPLMCQTIARGFDGIGRSYANLQAPIAGAKRVFKVLEAGETVTKEGGTDRAANSYALSIKNLKFKYMDADTDTLTGINLEIAENKMVALVGESGSGKSTLLRAIIGLYEREDLGLAIGDLSFNESSTKNWRGNFAYVDQSCKLFDMSVKDNIAMGKAGRATFDDVKAAAARAAAHDFIETLDSGYDAPCGEKGGTLSGGQKQRVAIARALVKKAPVLVFDEATSALDAQSERHIMDTINTLRVDHTILITTHNLENIITADQIVVMDGGCIAETGTHDELMARKGLYHRLYTQG